MEISDKTFIELKEYPFYFACSDGNIYSKRGVGKKKASYGNSYKKLSAGVSSSGKGYLQVSLSTVVSTQVSKLVHRLIAEAFIGKISKGIDVSHKDGKKFNNVPSNLILESRKDNLKRKYSHGTMDNGFNNSRALISEDQLKEIRALLSLKVYTHQQIGDMYNVGRVFITKIKKRT